MTDISLADSARTTTIKPRLSLLSTRQQADGANRAEEPEQQYNLDALKLAADAGNVTMNNNNNTTSNNNSNINGPSLVPGMECQPPAARCDLDQKKELEPKVSNHTDENKMNVSKEDLVRLLSMLKTELQSKEVALASIKLEQLKRLINPVEISRSSLAKTYVELQDRLKLQEQSSKNSNNNKKAEKSPPSASQAEHQRHSNTPNSTESSKPISEQDHERDSLNMLSTLLELLDRHPLLALPRDSIYCLDYNCNELSTKSYLNLKIQHLDNLIEQHRRFRYYMNERLKRSEQRFMDLTLKLELEKSLKLEEERNSLTSGGKNVLLRHIDQLKEALEKEKTSKHAIVMTLLNELLDERERNDLLKQKIAELEKKVANNKTTIKPAAPPNKPRVPAKPAQLLDKQRSQSKLK